MELHERVVGETVVVELTGAIPRDSGAPSVLLSGLKRLVSQGYKTILLNLAQVAYMDSVMLGAMVQGYASSVKQGSTVKLVNASARMQELLSVTKLDTVFEML